jgi:DNA-binding GntR family transcriptional regulator
MALLGDAPADLGEEDSLPVTFRIDRKRPVADQVYDALKAAIVSVTLPPGSSISENRICRHFGVSRTPVRAAIIRLVDDELIDVFPQQGSFVSPISLPTIRDSHFVRRCLEVAVLEEAAKRWEPQLSARAHAFIARQEAAIEAGDVEGFHREDETFHRNFALSAGLEGVWNTIQGAKARVDRVHRLAAVRGRLREVIVEHASILEALDRGEGREAARRLEHHLDRILELLGALRARHAQYFVD